MSDPINAYQAWLGIPPEESADGPHHYQLLGLRVFEKDPQAIEAAARRTIATLSAFAMGPHQSLAERLILEVGAAAACLRDPVQKAYYDRALASGQPLVAAANQPQTYPPVPPAAAVSAGSSPAAAAVDYVQRLVQPGTQASEDDYALQAVDEPAPPPPLVTPPALPPPTRRVSRQGLNLQTIMAVLGGIVGLMGGYFIVYYLLGEDLLRLLPPREAILAVRGKAAPVETPKAEPAAVASPAKPKTATDTSEAALAADRASPRPVAPRQAPSTEEPAAAAALAFVAPPVNTTPLPGTAGAAVAKKLPQPSAEARQSMLSQLQSLYKAEFERANKPEGRAVFVSFLMETAGTLKSEPTAQFVLYREAYDRAIKLDDFVTAAEVIDELERTFEVDGFRLRQHLLTEALRGAKTPDDRAPLTQFAMELADHAAITQHTEELPKLISTTEAAARSGSKETRARVAARVAELKKMADDYVQVQAARKWLEQDPADPAASLIDGKYRCFVLGDWAGGLKLLAQSDHRTLAPAAQQDLAGPSESNKAAALGDVWFEIGTAEPALQGACARARHWYEQAATFAPGLEKAKIDKRLEQIAAFNLPSRLSQQQTGGGPNLPPARLMLTQQRAVKRTDLLSLLKADTPHTPGWTISQSSARVDGKATWARLQSPADPTGEYQVLVSATRISTATNPALGPLVIGLPSLRSQFLIVIDHPIAGKGYASYLSLEGYKRLEDNPTFTLTSNMIPRLPHNDSKVIRCSVTSREIAVWVENQAVIEYRGDMNRLAMPSEWAFGGPRSMFLGAHQGAFIVFSWSMAPLRTDAGQELPLETRPFRRLPAASLR